MSRRRRAGNRYGRRMRLDTWDFSKRVGSSRYSRVTRTDSRAVSEGGRMIATKASPGFSRATSSTTSNPLSYCGPSSIMRTSQESSLDSLIACAVPSPSFRQSTNNVGRLNPHIAIKGTSRLSACRRTPFRGLIATLPRVCQGHQMVTPVRIADTMAAIIATTTPAHVATTDESITHQLPRQRDDQ